jgi:hypothetical protein
MKVLALRYKSFNPFQWFSLRSARTETARAWSRKHKNVSKCVSSALVSGTIQQKLLYEFFTTSCMVQVFRNFRFRHVDGHARAHEVSDALRIQPRVKSLQSSYTELYPQTIWSSYTGLHPQTLRSSYMGLYPQRYRPVPVGSLGKKSRFSVFLTVFSVSYEAFFALFRGTSLIRNSPPSRATIGL